MKKLVIDARESGTTTGRYIDKLIEHLHPLKPDYQVIILTRAERIEFFGKIAPQFVILETPFKEFTFNEQIGLMRQIEGLEPDLVHFGMVQQPVWYKGRVVTTMHDLTTIRFKNPSKNSVVYWVKQQVYKWVNKRVAHRSAAIITPTQFVKDDVVAYTGIAPSKVTVTYEAADIIQDHVEPLPGLEQACFLLYIGRPTPHKNLGRLLESFVELKKTHPELKLVLAGKKDSLYEAHAKRAEQLGIQDVVFTGFVSEGQLKWLYEHCAVYVFPSLSEGFGLPALEAMLHGAPVVSSNATCLPEIEGDAASYFDPQSVLDMTNKIAAVLDDPLLRQVLISKGTSQAAKYSWRRMAKQTLSVYKKALRNDQS